MRSLLSEGGLSASKIGLLGTLLALRFAGILQTIVRPMGVILLARVAGMLLAAIAVQMVADSVIEFVHIAQAS